MTLQASGPIKWSQITQEFGQPISKDVNNNYSVSWKKWSPPAPWVKSSEGADGWYKSGDPSAWSQFMIEHAVYPSNTEPLVGTHQAIWRLGGESMSLLPAGNYTLNCQVDNMTTLYWDDQELGTVGSLDPVISSNSSYNTNTSFDINIPSTDVLTQHYLTANVSNGEYSVPPGDVGVEFDANGNLVVTGNGSKNIKLKFAWLEITSDGLAIGQYKIPELGVDFTQGIVRPPDEPVDGSQQYPNGWLEYNWRGNDDTWGYRDDETSPRGIVGEQAPWEQIVTVEVEEGETKVYECTKILPQNIIGADGENPLSVTYSNNKAAAQLDANGNNDQNQYTDRWLFRSNNNQRLSIKDEAGNDANAQIIIMAETEQMGMSIEQDSSSSTYYDPEKGELSPGDGSGVIRGNPNNDSLLPSHITAGDASLWENNPAGIAWELKNSSGEVIRRSSDSFNYTYPSPSWGTMLQTYGVYPSTNNSLVDKWYETNYLFTTNNSSTYDFMASADSKYEIYLYDPTDDTEVLWMNAEGNESCHIGASYNKCSTRDGIALPTNTTFKLRVRVYNASSTSVPVNSWLYNPGGFAFTIKDGSGNIIKTSLDNGDQGALLIPGDGGIGFGNYRITEAFGSLTNVPLDTDAGREENLDIPIEGPIKFSNFYNARLNMAVDYYTGDTEYRPENGRTRYNDNNKVRVIGGFRTRPTNPTGKKIILHINKLIGVDEVTKVGDYSGQSSKCAFRTGSDWGESGTKVRIDVGSSGQVIGAGGNGGTTPNGSDSSSSPGNPGVSGTGAIGIQYEGTVVNVRTGGAVKAGCGGGGGGGNHGTDDGLSGENATGGGGGGGAGLPPGAGGIAGEGHEGDGGDGSNGTISAGGAGGSGSDSGGDDSGADESGMGGYGGGYTTDYTNGLTAGQNGVQTGESGDGGAGGASGGAIRKTTGTTWTFGDEHVTDNVFGTGKGGASESPIGVE